MTAFLRIDQDGLPEGTAGRSRTDGLATGALVTLTDTSPGSGSTAFKLFWTPPRDTGAVSSLAPTEDPKVWTFAPTEDKYGSYLIELVRNAGLLSETTERRVLVMRTPNLGLIIPALGERGYPSASLDDDRGAELVDNNATDFADPDLNELPFAAWWRAMHELIMHVDDGVPDPLRIGRLLEPGDLEYWLAAQIRLVDTSVGIGAGGDPFFSGLSPGLVVLAAFPPVSGSTYSSLGLGFDSFVVNVVGEGSPSIVIQTEGRTSYTQNSESHVFSLFFQPIIAMERNPETEARRLGFFGAPPVERPSIVGATTQLQVDSLVAALVALGLVTDDR
jgi:hypothetical protein